LLKLVDRSGRFPTGDRFCRGGAARGGCTGVAGPGGAFLLLLFLEIAHHRPQVYEIRGSRSA
jgi:hypothetical protein